MVVVRWSLWVVCYGSVAVDRLLWVGRCGSVLRVGRCGLIAVVRSLWVGPCGLVAVGCLLCASCYVDYVARCGSVVVLVGCCGLVAVVCSLWLCSIGRSLWWSIAVVVGRYGLVAMSRSLCRSVATSLSLWVDCYGLIATSGSL